MGKTDKRLHDRTKAADFPDRWAQTFGKALDKTDTVPDLTSHEPDPCGGQQPRQ